MKQLLWFNDIYVIIYWKYTFTELCEIRIKTHKEVAGLGSWEFLYLSQLLISKSSDKFLLWGNTTPKGDCSGFFFFFHHLWRQNVSHGGEQTTLRSDMWAMAAKLVCWFLCFPEKFKLSYFLVFRPLSFNIIYEQRK